VDEATDFRYILGIRSFMADEVTPEE